MISDTLEQLSTYVNNAYEALLKKSVVIPEKKTIKNLSATIDLIQQASIEVPVGAVQNIRYSIIDNVLNVKWLDPDDVYIDGSFATGFGGTRLVMKVDSYPENENDGTVLVDNTVKNKYNLTAFTINLPVYEDDVVYYFRLFSYNSTGYFNTETQHISQNRFNSESYSWDELIENLHSYQEHSDLLPNAGDVIGLEYILSDYCYDSSNKKVMLNTRLLVYDNRDRLSSVTIPWVILGHNANVPLYVQYRRQTETGYENIFIQSVDDALSSILFTDLNSNQTTVDIDIGTLQLRQITTGCRVYTETWDLTANIHTYTDTNYKVLSTVDDTFAYSNQGLGRNNAYLVPLSVIVNDKEYKFCGYTITMLSVNCLNTYGTTHYTTIQFDAPELLTAYIFEKYPDSANSDQYYYLDENGYHEIDWIGQGLFSLTIYQYNGHDIYLKSDNRMKLMTLYFKKELFYFKLDTDGTTRIPYVWIDDFKTGTIYSTANTVKSYGNFKTFFNNIPNDYVRYNGKIYKCIKSTLTTTAIDITTLNPATLTAYFQEDTSLSVQNYNYTPGDLIPSDDICGFSGGDRANYGCNIYSQSFYRQYCNNTNGSMDANYIAQSKFDNVSKVNLANGNGLLLKLFKEQDFIKHIKKAANLTVVSTILRGYKDGNTSECVCDLFWPLGYYEVFGDGTKDGIATFATVYPDAASRIKYYMTLSGTKSTSASYWWLRYPTTGYTYSEYNVNTSGTATNTNAYNSYGFAPACLIS